VITKLFIVSMLVLSLNSCKTSSSREWSTTKSSEGDLDSPTGRVINAHFNARELVFKFNVEHPRDRDSFIRTNTVILKSKKIDACMEGCTAKLGKKYPSGFTLSIDDRVAVLVDVHDPDSILPSSAFSLVDDGSTPLSVKMDLDEFSLSKHKKFASVMVAN
jgi:hypothetical protein